MIETRGQRCVDCGGDARKEYKGIPDDRVADDKARGKVGDERDEEKAEEDHIERQVDEMARAPEIDQRPDRQHGKPCGDVNEIGKCTRQDGRTHSTE